MTRLAWLAPLLGLVLSACSLVRAHQTHAAFPSLAPATLGTSVSTLQVLRAAFGQHEVIFQCVVAVNPQLITVVGLSAQGQRLFSLSHDGSTLKSRLSPQAPPQLDPQRVLADLQLGLWPLTALQQALAGTAWQVNEPTPGTRRLRRNGRLVAEVHYADADPWRGRLWLSNFESRYSIAVESQPLP